MLPHASRGPCLRAPIVEHIVQHGTEQADADGLYRRVLGHAGTVVGILAGGLSLSTPSAPALASTSDAMAVDSTTTPAAVAVPALSIAAQKKLDDAKAERERKYPGIPRKGIVLAAEKKVTSKLLEKDMGSSEKVFLVNSYVFRSCALLTLYRFTGEKSGPDPFVRSNILSAVAGITADANSLVSYARNAAQVRFASLLCLF